MLFLLKLMFAVSERTVVGVRARFICHPLFAKLCFDLDLVILRKNSVVTLERKRIWRVDRS